MEKSTIYTVFANSMKDRLPNLTEEAMSIAHIFLPLAFNDKLYYIKDEIFDVDRLTQNFSKYGSHFTIFYFSGHSKDGCINLTNDYRIEPERMSRVILSSLKQIKLIFLNACETFPLAKEIIRQTGPDDQAPIIISCGTEINTYLAETFAQLLFQQIGQEEPFKSAYTKAKDLVTVMDKENKIVFREFNSREDVINANGDFTISYIEISNDQPEPDGQKTAKKHSSIIGNDKLTRDALTTNYLTSVVESIASKPDLLSKDKINALNDALTAAKMVAEGKKDDKEVRKVFDKAASQLPGIDSRKIFSSLINTEKNIAASTVQSYVDSNDSVIDNLQEMVKKIDVIDI